MNKLCKTLVTYPKYTKFDDIFCLSSCTTKLKQPETTTGQQHFRLMHNQTPKYL